MFSPGKAKDAMSRDTPDLGESVLTDTELLSKAKQAENGEAFVLLYEEGWEDELVRHAYGRRRNAALAMMVHLVWWSRHDREQSIRLFKQSAVDCATNEEDYRDYFQLAVECLEEDAYDPEYNGQKVEQ